MDNPWKKIPYADYERHMSDPSVGQTAVLNEIFRRQCQLYRPRTVVYFGVCTGNGLEHIDPSVTSSVIGIDISKEYLDECVKRFGEKGFDLKVIEADLNLDLIQLPPADLFVANLVLEYIDLQRLLSVVKESGNEGCIFSTVIQINHSESFVSHTGIPSLEPLSKFHVTVTQDEIIDTLTRNRFTLIATEQYRLPGKKEFLRLDFKMDL